MDCDEWSSTDLRTKMEPGVGGQKGDISTRVKGVDNEP